MALWIQLGSKLSLHLHGSFFNPWMASGLRCMSDALFLFELLGTLKGAASPACGLLGCLLPRGSLPWVTSSAASGEEPSTSLNKSEVSQSSSDKNCHVCVYQQRKDVESTPRSILVYLARKCQESPQSPTPVGLTCFFFSDQSLLPADLCN